MNYFLLVGIVIIVVGFALKLDSIAVVLVAAIVTALIGGINFFDILKLLGEQFVSSRYMSLFFLTLPVIGICERYGLRERAMTMIGNMKVVTTGKLLSVYLFIREIAAAMSLRLGGHPQFIRPLVEPMAQGAAEKSGHVSEELQDEIKGAAAAAENYGNFFAQNVFYASGGVLLVVRTLTDAGFELTALTVSMWSIPVAIVAFIVAFFQFRLLDKKIENASKRGEQ